MRLIGWMVARPIAMAFLFLLVVGGAGLGYAVHPKGFLPTEDQGYAVLMARLPEGAAQPRVIAVARKVDDIIRQTPGIQAWVTIGGFSIIDNANLPNTFTTFLVYQDWSERGAGLDQEKILGDLRGKLAGGIEEAQTFVVVPPPIRGLGQSGGFQMMVEDRQSLGLEELQKAAQEVARAAAGQSGLRNVVSTFSARSPQLYLDIDRTKAESLNIPLTHVFQTLQTYLGSTFVNLFNKFNQVFQVYVQADAPYRSSPEDIQRLYVRNERGEMVPLGTLLQARRILGAELITRYNLYPAAQIIGASAPGFSSGQALELMEAAALAGVLAALWVRGLDANLYTQVGLVLMIALASKNAILVVEFARQLREEGKSSAEAAIEATRRRFRPILMTSFAFILGVVPLVFATGAGAASRQSIGTVVFGGMLASTLLAISFVPVFFVLTQRGMDWLKSRSRGRVG